MRLPGVDIFQQIVARDVFHRVDAQRVHPHVQIAVDRADQIILDVLTLGGEVDAIAGDVFQLHRRAFPVAAADKAVLHVPFGIEVVGVDAEEAAGVVAGLGHRLAGFGIDQRFHTVRVTVMTLLIPVRCDRVVDVVPIRPSVIAEAALIRPVVDPALLRALRHVVFDRQMVDMHLAANAVLAGMVDHHVLNDLDAALVGFVDQILVGRVRRFQAGIDPGPVVGVVAVIIQAATIFHRWGDPDRGKTEIADVIEPLDQSLEIAAPVRVFRLAGFAVELETVAAEEADAGIAFVKTGRQQEINGFFAEIVAGGRNRIAG